jgi:hypothetical protein
VDPSGIPVEWSSAIWSEDALLLTLQMATPRLLEEGVWNLFVGDEFRDSAGNRIDGDFDDIGGGGFVSEFGSVPDDAPDVSDCTTDSPRFRPDGDDGNGFETDTVTVSLDTSGPATWWVVEVEDRDASLVDHRRSEPAGTSSGSLYWDGRGLDGLVVSNGFYTMNVYATDLAWNVGEPCVITFQVDNPIGPVE